MAKVTKEDKKMLLIGGALVALLLVFSLNPKEQITVQATGGWDITEQVKTAQLEQFLVEEHDFDYSNPDVFQLAQEIKQNSNSPYDAIKDTAKHVYKNVQYSSKISVGYCYEETASSVLQQGYGDCVSMSRLVTALLRAQGIPTRTVGGCLSLSQRCSPMFAAFPAVDAKTTPLQERDLIEFGAYKKRGFLHEWVEAWTPERGWILIESTSGQAFPKDCNSYIFYSYDSNKYDRCVITDANFWNTCAAS